MGKASLKKSDTVISHEELDNQEERIHPKDPKPTTLSQDKGENQIVTQILESSTEEIVSNPNNTNSESVELKCEILNSVNQDMEQKAVLPDIEKKPDIGPTNKTDKKQKVESVTIHEDVPADKDIDKVKESLEKTTKKVIDEEPE